jgi:hypothetical protein
MSCKSKESKSAGTLPGYLSAAKAEELGDLPFGDRPLTVFEEENMLLLGMTRADISAMTPTQLAESASHVEETSTLLLGC